MKHIAVIGTGFAAYFALSRYLSNVDNSESLNITIFEYGPKRGMKDDVMLGTEAFKLKPTTRLGFGGTSHYWHQVLSPLDPVDLKKGLKII